ncbi:chemotaxis protein CheA [Aestuariibacter salexigens]|uniref:chemotaxis protein CheA n=1 Tax=Aestuariibacter salexigens TaxID=226010 RepID=UPI0004229BAB|nr:chemotaxis protein CheA [Aestuariibacter salexigens]
MTDPMERFRQVFFDESAEALDTIEQHLLALHLPDVDDEVINDIFRSAHSLKGGSATFGMSALADFTHVMETLLDMVRAGTRSMDQAVVDCLFECLDCLRNLVNHYQFDEAVNAQQIEAVKAKLQFLIDDVASGDGQQSEQLAETGADQGKHWQIAFVPSPQLLLSGNEPLRYLDELSELGDLEVTCNTERVPELNDLSALDLHIEWQIDLSANDIISKEDLSEIFLWIEDDAELTFTCKDASSSSSNQQTDAPTPDVSKKASTAPSPSSEEATAAPSPSSATAPAQANKQRATQSIRVELKKIDGLINLLGELVITQSMLSTFKDLERFPQLQRLQEGLGQLERHTRDLQEGVMQIRMLPIDFCFSRFPRMVRDLCIQLGKEIDVEIIGETTEVDKTVIEELTDPLVHLVRNSIDHGIELPAKREENGKPRQGKLTLKAFHQVGNIIIEVGDDGQGLPVEKIRQKAIEKGVIKGSERLSEQAIKELIFAPGFSTAESVTDLSGRGVGMDVVRRNIQALGGQIEVRSEEGQGTTFSIRLPLTLAILDGQLISVAGETYVIPMLAIIESIQISSSAINRVGKQNVSFKWRDQFIPLLNLAETFGCHNSGEPLPDTLLVVVVESDKQQYGLIVDELSNHQQVVVKSLEANYIKVDELSGATILGDGSVALILDVGALTQRLKVH